MLAFDFEDHRWSVEFEHFSRLHLIKSRGGNQEVTQRGTICRIRKANLDYVGKMELAPLDVEVETTCHFKDNFNRFVGRKYALIKAISTPTKIYFDEYSRIIKEYNYPQPLRKMIWNLYWGKIRNQQIRAAEVSKKCCLGEDNTCGCN